MNRMRARRMAGCQFGAEGGTVVAGQLTGQEGQGLGAIAGAQACCSTRGPQGGAARERPLAANGSMPATLTRKGS